MTRKRTLIGTLLALGAAVTIWGAAYEGSSESAAPSGATRIPQPSKEQLAAAGLHIKVAPESKRVDLVAPPFSRPTQITNPLFPIAKLPSAILSGRVDGKDFKTETTVLPETRIVEWQGRQIRTLASQYLAYLDGRIEEVAIDHYAQADDGSVWYLGEDVFNYADGAIADTEGTWFAGREGPPALIMPARPKVGDVYRPENIPGLVFEEVKIKTVGKTVAGPHGPVKDAIVASELHQDGSREDKVFAPGYGEFHTGSGGDVEAMTLAAPADNLPGPVPAQLTTLSSNAGRIFDQVRAGTWPAASASLRAATTAWNDFRAGQVPPRLETRMNQVMATLTRTVAAHDARKARLAAVAVGQGSLDLQLRHRPPAEIDRGRFELWARQLVVDAEAGDADGVRGDLATLEWIRDRFVHTLDKIAVTRLDTQLTQLRALLNDDDLRGAARAAARLGASVR